MSSVPLGEIYRFAAGCRNLLLAGGRAAAVGPPSWALIESFGNCSGGIPFLVKPVQVRFVDLLLVAFLGG